MKAAFTSDWHCDRNRWARYPELAGDSLYALDQIVTYCISNGLDVLLAAGDLTETPNPPPSVQAEIHRQMDRMARASIPVLFIQGQHERNAEFPRLGVHPWPKWLHLQTETIGNTKIAAFDWTPPSRLPAALQWAADTRPHVLMCHQVWAQFMGSICETEGDLKQCPAPIVLTGDYHKHEFIKVDGPEGKIRVFSPGSMSLRALNEPADKFFFVVDFDFSGPYEGHTSVPLKSRSIRRIELDDEAALADVLEDVEFLSEPDEDLPEELQKSILSIKYHESIPDAYTRLTEAFRDKVHLFLSSFGAVEKTPAARSATREMLDQGMLGCLKMLPIDPEVRMLAEDLLRSNDTTEILDVYKNAFLEEGATA